MGDVFYSGNKELLKCKATGFLASRVISPKTVLTCYDWAVEMREKGVCVMSGFSSNLEKDVLKFLLEGTQPLVVVLGRALYKKVPEIFAPALEQNRLLFVSPVPQTISRQSEETAFARNKYIASHAEKTVFASVTEKSSLWPLYKECEKSEMI